MRQWQFRIGLQSFALVERGVRWAGAHGLAPDRALRVIALALRGGALQPLSAAYRDLTGQLGVAAPGEETLLRWFGSQLGAGGPAARLALTTADGTSPDAQRATQAAAEPSAAETLAREIARSMEGPLGYQGRQYLVTSAAAHATLPGRGAYEAVSPQEASEVLLALEAEAWRSAAQRALLQRALQLLQSETQRGQDALVLLRRERHYQRPVDAGARVTPSQLKQVKPVDYLEVQLVDVDGKPYANEPYEVTLPDGSTRRGSLDRDGFLYLGDIPSGSCAVRFLKYARST